MEATTQPALRGQDLILAGVHRMSEVCKESLYAAFLDHLRTGASMDDLLMLRPHEGGKRTARTDGLLHYRGQLLVEVALDILDADSTLTMWQVAGLIHQAMQTDHHSMDEITMIGEWLGLDFSSHKSIYNALGRVFESPAIG